jgi:hypothetical protein
MKRNANTGFWLVLAACAIVGLAAGHLLGVIHPETVEAVVICGGVSLVVWSVGGVGVSLLSVVLEHKRAAPTRPAPRRADLENYSVRRDGGAERITV